MQFRDIPGHEQTKRFLIQTVNENRISHAQLFLGPEGCGKLALSIAYAQYVSCSNRSDNDSCGECPSCLKYQKLIHPDLHFAFPVVTSSSNSKPVSDNFLTDWRKFVSKRNYHRLGDWYDFIGVGNSQGAIYEQESREIQKKLNLKSYEGEYKVMIIWMAEKMNETCANKLLKMIEEPPPKTLFLLIAENEEAILTTIRSRTQLVKISKSSQQNIEEALKIEFPDSDSESISNSAMLSDGNYLEAVSVLNQFLSGDAEIPEFTFFKSLMRSSFSRKYDEIIKLSDELSKLGRERQKRFFDYCQRLIRECFMFSTISSDLVKLTPSELKFVENFAKFIHQGNIAMISELFSEAYRNIERNAYGKLVFTDLAIKLSTLLRMQKA